MAAMDRNELAIERAYADRVRRRIMCLIDDINDLASDHRETVREIIADAWDELRSRPTALSPQDIQQLERDIDRIVDLKRFENTQLQRYSRLMREPFFARIDFREERTPSAERIMLGIYSVKDENGDQLVCDWRAPIGNLYYDGMPGNVSYISPMGEIRGEMTLKRQYSFENGELKYYIDTLLSIDDGMLLDLLGKNTDTHMRQIVATIQKEQNCVIRHRADSFISVIGGAGSGKTSVAMHRAAYLMYRAIGKLDAAKIQIMSTGTAFTEYISLVLPELGEKNIRTATMHEVVTRVIDRAPETPEEQQKNSLAGVEARLASIRRKGDMEFLRQLEEYASAAEKNGPKFEDIPVEDRFTITAAQMRDMYTGEYSRLNPAQRLERMYQSLTTRLESFENDLRASYEAMYSVSYHGRALNNMVNLAVENRLAPIMSRISSQVRYNGDRLLTRAYERLLPKEELDIYLENREAGILWWEDAVTLAFLALRLGFASPDKNVYHLLIDEAQDYTETALRVLKLNYPQAVVTCLGDPMQRTQEGLGECLYENWAKCFGEVGEVFRLDKCYRSSSQIAAFCKKILPECGLNGVGRDAEEVKGIRNTPDSISARLKELRGQYRRIAVITRTQRMADALSSVLPDVYRIDGADKDAQFNVYDTVVACYHMVKGLEFDAVIVVWDAPVDGDTDRRRFYTACTRALHSLTVSAPAGMLEGLGL